MRRQASGFTLVEVLIAIAILVTGMTGVLAVFATASRSSFRAARSIEASNIAMSVVAEARARYGSGVSLPNAKGETFPGKPRYTYDIEYVHGLDKDDNELIMVVRVNWLRRGRETSVEYATILLRKMD